MPGLPFEEAKGSRHAGADILYEARRSSKQLRSTRGPRGHFSPQGHYQCAGKKDTSIRKSVVVSFVRPGLIVGEADKDFRSQAAEPDARRPQLP